MSIEFDKNGWLFPDAGPNVIHDITYDDLSYLWKMSVEEDRWVDNLKRSIIEHERSQREDTYSTSSLDWIIEETRIKNVSGTVIPFPYGLRAITFPTKRHIFRGENKKYASTVPSLNRSMSKIIDAREKEMYRVIAYMRKQQFAKLIWQINIVPFWEAKLFDVNFDALAHIMVLKHIFSI